MNTYSDDELRALQAESDRKTQRAIYIYYYLLRPAKFVGIFALVLGFLYVFSLGLVELANRIYL